MIRPSRIWAIARRDLAIELKGRQGLLLPMVITGLLLPASAVRLPTQRLVREYQDERVSVSGDVPDEVRALPLIVPKSRVHLRFDQQGDVLVVDGPAIPKTMRRVLDGEVATVPVEYVSRGYAFPGRTALLSLITASTLTGAVSQSIGGERSRKTLVVLLAAAISRSEIILGKWVAWGGFGAMSSLLGAAMAIAMGNAEPGWWLVPLPTVPLATVALGLWLVRRSGDVMSGSATSLRALPAALSIAAVIAWLFQDQSPWLGALVPLGGGLLAAGQIWAEPGPTLLAAASTLVLAGVALIATIRDLEEVPDRNPPEERTATALLVGVVATAVWWLPVAGPVLWSEAGNPKIAAALSREQGVLAGVAGLLTFSAVRAARATGSIRDELGLRWPSVDGWFAAAGAAVVLIALGASAHLWPGIGHDDARARFADALQPGWAGFGLAVLAILADECLFRGWLARIVGPGRATAVWTVVKLPFDPLLGLGTGAVCAWLAARTGSIWPSVAARLVWLVVASVWFGVVRPNPG